MPAKRPPNPKMVALGERISNLPSTPLYPRMKLLTDELVEIKVTLNEVESPVWRNADIGQNQLCLQWPTGGSSL